MATAEPATVEMVEAAVYPELDPAPTEVTVGGVKVAIVPLKRRWQRIFSNAVLPMYSAELSGTESMEKTLATGIADYTSIAEILISSEIKSDEALDLPAAVILASKIDGAEKNLQTVIDERMEWLQNNARTEEMRALVDAQATKERLIESVGERLPARLLRSARLAGNKVATLDSVSQALTSFLPRSPAPTGDGT
jgi:hypothetical protein